MTHRIRYITLMVATIMIIVFSPVDRVNASIAFNERVMYSVSGKPIGKIPRRRYYETIERLPDGRLKVKYGKLIGYLR